MAETEKKEVRLVLTVSRDLIDEIEDYRFSHRLLSRAAAIRELIRKGLREPRRTKPESPP